MKNSKKVLLALMCVAFCVVILACASSGGGGAAASGPSVGVLGVWELEPANDANDKGSSTITMTTAEEEIDGETVTTYHFKGVVTDQTKYGLCQVTIKPDEDTLAQLRSAKAISFKMLADGRPYVVEAPTALVTDWGFHRYTVKTEPAGEVHDFKIEMRFFMQPAWATAVRFYPNRLESIRIQTVNAAEGGTGPFEFKIWDIKTWQ
ncbi:MAG: CIA30 family protein [Treponema sp.]|jgi:hypothetical protein|nr:CIA30 family protein [Treponema sp.]